MSVSKIISFVKKHYSVILVILYGFLIQITFPYGIFQPDDLTRIRSAHELSILINDLFRSLGDPSTIIYSMKLVYAYLLNQPFFELLLIIPPALIFSIFGTSQLTSLMFSQLCSALVVILIYKFGIDENKRMAGVTAGLLWSSFPLIVRNFSTFIIPPALLFFFGGVYIGVKINSNIKTHWRILYYFAGFGILSLFSIWLGISFLFSLFAYIAFSNRKKYTFLWMIFPVFLIMLISVPDFAAGSLGLIHFFFNGRISLFLLALLIISMSFNMREENGKSNIFDYLFYINWVIYVFSELMPSVPGNISGESEIFKILFLIPIIYLGAQVFFTSNDASNQESDRKLQRIVLFIAIVIITLAYPPRKEVQTLILSLINIVYGLLFIILFFVITSIPKNNNGNKFWSLILISGLLLVMIFDLHEDHEAYYARTLYPRIAQGILKDLDETIPVYVLNEELALRFELEGYFSREDQPTLNIEIMPRRTDRIHEHYVLLWEHFQGYIAFIPDEWSHILTIGNPEQEQLMLYFAK